MDIPYTGSNRGAVGSVGRADAASDKGCYTVGEAVVGLLWIHMVYVAVDTGGGKDKMFA